MALYKRGNVWWIEFCYKGRRYREGVGPIRKDAQYVLAKRKAEARENRLFDVRRECDATFDEIAAEYLKYSEVNKRSFERDVRIVAGFQWYFAGKKLSEITPKMIEDYKAARSKEVKSGTVNRELACLKHLFNMAIRWHKATTNPVKEVKLFRQTPGRLRVLSEQEEGKLLAASCPHLKPMILTAVNTGLRRGELLHLRWEDVNFEHGYLTARQTKNGESRQIPMSQRLTEVFNDLRGNSMGPCVFCKEDGSPYGKVVNAFSKAVKRSGIEHCRFHDLRHTFATRLVMNGVDLVTVKELLGHKSIEMTMRYAHPAPDHKRWAVETLNLQSPHNFHHSAASESKAVFCQEALSEAKTDD